MRNILLALLAFAWLCLPARAADISATDKAAINQVIESQLRAFSVDDGVGAYAHAAPIVKGVFKSVDQFMAMVKQGYAPVYRNRGHEFGETFTDALGRPAQRVILQGLDGKTYEANYFMERQPDGTWLIAGCVLVVIPGLDV